LDFQFQIHRIQHRLDYLKISSAIPLLNDETPLYKYAHMKASVRINIDRKVLIRVRPIKYA
jgi:hypothetical protein